MRDIGENATCSHAWFYPPSTSQIPLRAPRFIKKGTLALKHFNILFQIRYLSFLYSFIWQVVLEPASLVLVL
jgi:hypothetical protein